MERVMVNGLLGLLGAEAVQLGVTGLLLLVLHRVRSLMTAAPAARMQRNGGGTGLRVAGSRLSWRNWLH
jgi:hypothetical protein